MTRIFPALLCAVTLMAAPAPAIADPADKQLFEAVASADKDEVRRLLEADANPNAGNEEGVKVLHRAIWATSVYAKIWRRKNDVDDFDDANVADVVELLLDSGSDVSAQLPADSGLFFDEGDTPLHIAAKLGTVDICRLLLERGANVHARNLYGKTALHNSDPETIGLLLDAGADIDARDAERNTALHLAASRAYRHHELVRLLLEAGADIDARNAEGSTPLHLAAAGRGHQESVQLLLNAGADIDARNVEGDTALHRAAGPLGHHELVQLLLEAGADVDAPGAKGDTALHRAAWPFGHHEPIRLLLEAGADVDARDSIGNTPLLEIIDFPLFSLSMSESVQLLLDAGADINARNAYGVSSLERARASGQEDLMRLLLGLDAEAWNAWMALGEGFQLYNACSPIDFLVTVDNADNGSLHGLTEEDIQTAIESRLRAARLYDSDANAYLHFYVSFMDVPVGAERVAWVYNTDFSFNKFVQDEASGQRMLASTWGRASMGIASSAESVGESILGNVRGYMDQFLAEYLRVNEKACE